MAGYSATPLVKKLGIKAGDTILLIHPPDDYDQLIGKWPENLQLLKFDECDQVDFIHFFTQQKSLLAVEFPFLKDKLKRGGMLWISWPKGKSTLHKDLNENDIRAIGLKHGLVDVKVCAVDENWSALKFVFRKMKK